MYTPIATEVPICRLSKLPYDVLTTILRFVAHDVAAAINLALTCKLFLNLGMSTPVPSHASSPRADLIGAPDMLQSCDLCHRYWVKGAYHDDDENWSKDFRILRENVEQGFQSYRCIICPGGGETLRKWEEHRPRADIRNRLAEELSIFQQALQAS